MSEIKTTPGPWEVAESPGHGGLCKIVGFAPNTARTPLMVAEDLFPGNAALIVRAVNAHEALLDACRAVHVRLSREREERALAGLCPIFPAAAYIDALAGAIAKAEA